MSISLSDLLPTDFTLQLQGSAKDTPLTIILFSGKITSREQIAAIIQALDIAQEVFKPHRFVEPQQ